MDGLRDHNGPAVVPALGGGWAVRGDCYISGIFLGRRIKVSITPDLAVIVPVVDELQA